MPRLNPRTRIDVLAQEAARALSERRDAVLPSDYALDQAATVRRSDIESAISFYREAVTGSDLERLLDGPAREDERL